MVSLWLADRVRATRAAGTEPCSRNDGRGNRRTRRGEVQAASGAPRGTDRGPARVKDARSPKRAARASILGFLAGQRSSSERPQNASARAHHASRCFRKFIWFFEPNKSLSRSTIRRAASRRRLSSPSVTRRAPLNIRRSGLVGWRAYGRDPRSGAKSQLVNLSFRANHYGLSACVACARCSGRSHDVQNAYPIDAISAE